jgi:hypothetical protein
MYSLDAKQIKIINEDKKSNARLIVDGEAKIMHVLFTSSKTDVKFPIPQEQKNPLNWIINLPEKTIFEKIGSEKIDKIDCDKYKGNLDNKNTFHLWIDSKSKLLIRFELDKNKLNMIFHDWDMNKPSPNEFKVDSKYKTFDLSSLSNIFESINNGVNSMLNGVSNGLLEDKKQQDSDKKTTPTPTPSSPEDDSKPPADT